MVSRTLVINLLAQMEVLFGGVIVDFPLAKKQRPGIDTDKSSVFEFHGRVKTLYR